MKYSYNWLKELTKSKKNPKELAEMVMLKGFELEGIEDLAGRFKGFVVGKILEIKKHPNADKLQLVKVDVGKQKLDIVCGAWNIKVGDVVPVALEGAILPLNKMKVEKREVRGVTSNGMLCAEDELGLGKDHSGIMILENSLKPGIDLAQALNLDDGILEFDVLPNRAHDCLSYEGMGREISAMNGENFQISNIKYQISNKLKSSKSKFLNIVIKDKKLCPRYIGAVLMDVKVGPSPDWMQARLVASGMEPINNVVDITNYVMLETGNPLHCFDFRKIKTEVKSSKLKVQSANILIRKANKGEKLELLDGAVLVLDENDLVIANEEKALALAGIKGGKDSGISGETTDIVLEAANFQALNIRKSRQRQSLLTESQQRFEKGISPVLAERAALRAIELLQKLAGAKLLEINDLNYFKQKPQLVKLDIEYASRLLGYGIGVGQITKILENLGFELKSKSAKNIIFEVPYWRLDIEGQEDLIEEIGRLTGYEKVDEKPIKTVIELPNENEWRDFEWKIKDIMVAMGFDEVMNYSFISETDVAVLNDRKAAYFKLENPLNSDQNHLRRSLLPNLLKNVAFNTKYFEDFSIFEVGRVYFLEKYNGQPEDLEISGAVVGSGSGGEEIFYLAKGRLDNLFERLGLTEDIKYTKATELPDGIFHKTRTAQILLRGESIGCLGQADASICKRYRIKREVVLFELDFEKIVNAFLVKETNYKPARKFPLVQRDISMYVDPKTEADQVVEIIKKTAKENLVRLELFDVFIDKDNNKKSLAFHLYFGDENKTLEGNQADNTFSQISKELQLKLKAKVRTK